MSTPYIIDTLPLIGDYFGELIDVYCEIPSLQKHLYSKDNGIVIYGNETHPCWSISVDAYKGSDIFNFWMNSLPVSLLTKIMAMLSFHFISNKKFICDNWKGRIVVVHGGGGIEMHFLLYSHKHDISLDLHIESCDDFKTAYKKAIAYLNEIKLK